MEKNFLKKRVGCPLGEYIVLLQEIDSLDLRKGQILRSTPNTAPLICGAYNTQPEGLLTTA